MIVHNVDGTVTIECGNVTYEVKIQGCACRRGDIIVSSSNPGEGEIYNHDIGEETLPPLDDGEDDEYVQNDEDIN